MNFQNLKNNNRSSSMDNSRKSRANSIATIAENYSKLGWKVLPVHGILNQQCACGKSNCQSPGKHPAVPHGVKDSTNNPTLIRRWFAKRNNKNIGIATGKESGLVVLDIDPRHNGENSLARLQKEYGNLPPTLQVRTGGGGLHFYFKYPNGVSIKSRTNLFPGIDIRADGGYVVAPPSEHRSSPIYQKHERHIKEWSRV